MKTPKTKELGKNNYKLLGAAVAVAVAAIPLAIASIKAGAGALIAAAVLFLLAMLLPAKRAEAVKSSAPAAPVVAPAAEPVKYFPYEVERFPVVGVTFTNGNTKRQDILRHAYFHDNPFGNGYGVIIRPEKYEGADAVGVYITHEGRDGLTYAEQIGNVPAESVPGVLSKLDRFDRVTNLDIYGGGAKKWGAAVFLRFWRESAEHVPSDLTHEGVVFGREKRRSSAEVKNDLPQM